jgi:hypothetical protein
MGWIQVSQRQHRSRIAEKEQADVMPKLRAMAEAPFWNRRAGFRTKQSSQPYLAGTALTFRCGVRSQERPVDVALLQAVLSSNFITKKCTLLPSFSGMRLPFEIATVSHGLRRDGRVQC